MALDPAFHQARVVVSGPGGDRLALVRYRTGGPIPDVGALARELGFPADTGLAIDGRRIAATIALREAGLADGSRLEPADRPAEAALPWTLWVIGGADTGRSWPVSAGASLMGPGPVADIPLDLGVGSDGVTIHVDLDGSATVIDREGAHTAAPGEPLPGVGRLLMVTARPGPPARPRSATTIPVRPSMASSDTPPIPPGPPPRTGRPPAPPPFGWISALAPLAMGAAVAVLWSPRFALFAAFGPVIAVGTWLEQRRRHRRSLTEHATQRARQEADHRLALDRHAETEAEQSRRRLPAFPVLSERARTGGPGLWATTAPLVVAAGWQGVSPVELGLLGTTTAIAGPEPRAVGVACHLIVQLAVSHPPTDLEITPGDCLPDQLGWIGWLPHRSPDSGTDRARLRVLSGDAVPDAPPGANEADLLILSDGQEPPPWVGTSLALGPDGTGTVELTTGALEDTAPPPVMAAPLRPADAARVARHLARWRPVAHLDSPPRAPALLGLDRLVGPLDDVDTLLDRWARSSCGRHGGGLPAPVGVEATGAVAIDLVKDGPHAVIGGTTGSGKSELLRTLIASLCACHPPESVTFVLVDYKGGSAFDGCAGLPHVTTVVTDLDGSRTDRVLTAVDAELTRRERWLREHGRSDLDAAADLPGRPARLVVTIDEFATLARDQPDFLPALVEIARRGRSLGLHLVLATQRPAGAMTDDIRANTDLRMALRMVDGADSTDVIGVTDAASIPADQPGRVAMRRAGGAVEVFQAATASAAAISEPALRVRPIDDPATIAPPDPVPAGPSHAELLAKAAGVALARSGRRAAGPLWPPDLPTELSPHELDRGVQGGDPGPHADRPQGVTPAGRPDSVTVGLTDDLTATRHQPCRWTPSRGVLALSGTHGSDMAGVTTGVVSSALRQLGPWHVYAADATGELEGWVGSGSVAAVVPAEDRDGMRRLVQRLERDGRRGRGRSAPPRLLVLHDQPAIAGALDDLDGLRLLDRLHRIVADGPRRGMASVVSTPRPGTLPPIIAGSVDRSLVLHVAVPDDYRLVGLRPPTSKLPPGRALDERGTPVQLARLDPAALPAVAATATADRPRPLRALPTRVRPQSTTDGPSSDPWLLPVGVDQDGPVALHLAPSSATVVAGPPGSGRTTALRTIATEAERRGTRVLRLDSSSTDHAAQPSDRSHGAEEDGPVGPLGGALGPGTGGGTDPGTSEEAGAPTGTGVGRRLLVVVDDATEVEDADGTLAGLVRGRLRPPGVRLLLAVDPVDWRSAYAHWTSSLRRCRWGIALHHDPDEDRDLWAPPLPPAPAARLPPGRGLLLLDGEDTLEVQVARP